MPVRSTRSKLVSIVERRKLRYLFRYAWVGLLLLRLWGAETVQKPPDETNAEAATETILIDTIKDTSDLSRRIELLAAFVKSFPENHSTGWAYKELLRALEETRQQSRALEIVESRLSVDPRDVELAYQAFQIAQRTGDQPLIQKWSILLEKATAVSYSTANDDAGKTRQEFARQVRVSQGYSDYRKMLETADKVRRIELIEKFLQQAIPSDYKHAVESLYLSTYLQMGDTKHRAGSGVQDPDARRRSRGCAADCRASL